MNLQKENELNRLMGLCGVETTTNTFAENACGSAAPYVSAVNLYAFVFLDWIELLRFLNSWNELDGVLYSIDGVISREDFQPPDWEKVIFEGRAVLWKEKRLSEE